MVFLSVALLVAALALFVVAAFAPPVGRVNLVAAGLACMALAELVGRGGLLGLG